jgi:hypothetical protein
VEEPKKMFSQSAEMMDGAERKHTRPEEQHLNLMVDLDVGGRRELSKSTSR